MVTLLLAAVLGAPPVNCSYDKALLALPPARFDQDLRGGWRPLGEKKGCEIATANLLAAYREKHWGALKPAELHINYWHEGQMRAEAGDDATAIPLLLAGVDPDDRADFADYALGTVAFLQHDKAALLSARARLSRQPEPAWFKTSMLQFKQKFGNALIWPMNLNVLDGFLNCFDRSYHEAYETACQKPASRAG